MNREIARHFIAISAEKLNAFDTCSMVTPIYKNCVRKFGVPLPENLAAQKSSKFGPNVQQLRNLIVEYLWKETRNRRTENGVANCDLSCACLLNVVNFGPQTAKNRT